MPDNCVLLVDTYDTLQGVQHAIDVGKTLRAQGKALLGIRLDSGDLAVLSQKARQLLDAAGFHQTQIIASNSLDEYVIEDLRKQDAHISIWGVGTSLATAYDQAALDGVYKLSALRDAEGEWQYKLKLSEQAIKISNPGIYQVRRFFWKGEQIADVLYDVLLGMPATPEMRVIDEPDASLQPIQYDQSIDLLQPIFHQGKLICPLESIHVIRERAIQAVKQFFSVYPVEQYSVGLEKNLYDLKQKLINKLKY
jgi:nicotinate phosphoribosyltransferase